MKYQGYYFSEKVLKRIPKNDKVIIDHFLYENEDGLVTVFDVFKNFKRVCQWHNQSGFSEV